MIIKKSYNLDSVYIAVLKQKLGRGKIVDVIVITINF